MNVDSSKIMSVIQTAIPQFLGAMQRNSSAASGAAALTQALGNHVGQSFAVDLEDGKEILSKVFGGNLGSVIAKLGKQTGTSNDQVSGILASIAPCLLSVLGCNKDSGNIGDVLGSLQGGASNSGSGTGSVLGSLFGKLLKKK